ncbi:MAG: CopL family metal-binding regulatory protein [Xanthomonadales bacterium]|nr:CopL family metal-binding regulatory protein [Xanthomonadales bacterium]
MRLPSLLLHVLFSLALVANGMGTAMAALNTGCAHSEAAAVTAVEAPPCHEDMSSTAPPDDAMPTPPATTGHEGCGDDCSGHCDCGGCVAHSQAALIPPTLLLPVSERIAYPAAPAHARATPALPHPVRPPIG